jgi:hypothetical protein
LLHPFIERHLREPGGERYRGTLWIDIAALMACIAGGLPWLLHLLGSRIL